MLTKEEMDLFDDVLRKRFSEEQKKCGKTDDYVGRRAFGWIKSPRMKMQVLKGASTKKGQQMRFTDVINLCEVLGLSWIEEGLAALRVVKEQSEKL